MGHLINSNVSKGTLSGKNENTGIKCRHSIVIWEWQSCNVWITMGLRVTVENEKPAV